MSIGPTVEIFCDVHGADVGQITYIDFDEIGDVDLPGHRDVNLTGPGAMGTRELRRKGFHEARILGCPHCAPYHSRRWQTLSAPTVDRLYEMVVAVHPGEEVIRIRLADLGTYLRAAARTGT